MKKLLITRPEYDDTTYYLSNFSKLCIEKAKKKGVTVSDLHRERANKQEVTSIIAKQQPSLIVLNGHGSETTVTGHKNEPLLVAGENEELLKRKIVYAVSCQSAKILGKKSVDAGAQAYLGYEDDFVFVYDKKKMTRPIEDKTAQLFLAPSNEVVLTLLKGQPAGEAIKRSKELSQKNINKLLSSEAPAEDTSMVRYLWWNMKNQVCLGNKEATF